VRWKLVAGLFIYCMPLLAMAGSLEEALRKLEPEERAHQACIIKGLNTVHRDTRLRNADRMKTSIFGRAAERDTPRRKRWRSGGKQAVVRALVHLQFDARSHAGDIVLIPTWG
jgi:hypothetical protein